MVAIFFFFNDTATTEIYSLSLHDALPIYAHAPTRLTTARCRPWSAEAARPNKLGAIHPSLLACWGGRPLRTRGDPKSTRLNSRHLRSLYSVICLEQNNS